VQTELHIRMAEEADLVEEMVGLAGVLDAVFHLDH
jgi:hypothetical protein